MFGYVTPQPWSPYDVALYVCLVLATVMTASFPLAYAFVADLRDRLARAIIFATAGTAAAFLLSALLYPILKAGYHPPELALVALSCVLYLLVGVGKLLLLWQLLRRADTPKPPDIPEVVGESLP